MIAKYKLDLLDAIVKKCRAVSMTAKATTDVCGSYIKDLVDKFDCRLADVWSVDPRQRKLILVDECYRGNPPIRRIDVLTIDQSFTGEAVETGRITHFPDLVSPRPDGRRFMDPALRFGLGITSMVSIPILNTANPHQVLCVLNFFPRVGEPYSPSQWEGLKQALERLAQIIAIAIESNLRERTFRLSATLVSALASRQDSDDEPLLTIRSACGIFAESCLNAVGGHHAQVYLLDPIEEALELRAHVAIDHGVANDLLPASLLEDHRAPLIIQSVFADNREHLAARIPDDIDHAMIYGEQVSPSTSTCVVIPIQKEDGTSQGVLACYGDVPPSSPRMARFSYDDIAILEAMAMSFATPLASLSAAERRQFSQQRLSHEIRLPISTFDKMLSRMQAEARDRGFRFKHNHFREGRIYVDVMTRLIKEVDILRFGPEQIPLSFQPTDIESDVIMPAKRFTHSLLRKYHIYNWQIEHSGFEVFPKLMIDPGVITQVVFNLLDNAVKYYSGVPVEFRCWITGQVSADFFEITVADNGSGIEESQKDSIFRYGKRGSNRRPDAVGEGVGLWYSRRVVQRHGGYLTVSKCRNNTEFLLRLPRHRPLLGN